MNSIIAHENICRIVLDNNAENYLTEPEFVNIDELRAIIETNNCKSIIINGTGRHFSAGADIENIKKFIREGILSEKIKAGKKLIEYILSLNLPVIACIEGICFGGALEIALIADIKICSSKSLFAFPETNLNLIPGLNGNVILPGITGKAKALEIILSGNMIDAVEAKQIGIIDYITEPKNTLAKGIRIAESITQGRPIEVINAVVELVRLAHKGDYNKTDERETELFSFLASKNFTDVGE